MREAAAIGSAGRFFCDWACASEHKLRKPNNSQASRSQLFALEHGVCTACGLDAHALYRRVKALTPPASASRCSWRRRALPRAARRTAVSTPVWNAIIGRPTTLYPSRRAAAAVVWTTSARSARRATRRRRTRCASAPSARKNAAAAAGTRDLRSFFSVSSGGGVCVTFCSGLTSVASAVAVMARGSSFFFSSFRGAPESYGTDPRVVAARRGARVSRHVCSYPPHTSGRSPPHPPIVQPGLRTVDPILRSAQPPAAPQRPQLPTSPKIGARDPNKLLRETVSQSRDLPRRHSQPACPSSRSPRPGRRGRRGASARAA